MTVSIIPIADQYAVGFHACLDAVARERRFLGQTEAPPLEKIQAFVRTNIEGNYSQFVALDGAEVVGWCDAIPHWADALKHRAGLGMGVLKPYRGLGIGRSLLSACLDKARSSGLRRIDLEVRADNEPAIRLYESFGFAHEGRKPFGLCHGGAFFDTLEMGLVFSDAA
jgi:ribosomal protein S18 acetylase RimI-like enzyme